MQTTLNYLYSTTSWLLSPLKPLTRAINIPATSPAPAIPLWKLAAQTGPYVRLAAISGATAMIVGAYGAHNMSCHEDHQKEVFDIANRYHLVHSLALLGLPLCRARFLVAILMVSGMSIFCGTCYYYAITGNKSFNKITPFGGMCLILGWFAIAI